MAELAHVPRENFVIINGTGSHRANTRAELIQMLGVEVVETVQIVNHNAFDDATLTHMGRIVPFWEIDFPPHMNFWIVSERLTARRTIFVLK